MNLWESDASGRFLELYGTLRGVVRLTLMERQLSEHVEEPPARICDVGGGAGHNSIPLARRGYEVKILDPSEEMLQRAQQTLDAEEEAVRGRVELVSGSRRRRAAYLRGKGFRRGAVPRRPDLPGEPRSAHRGSVGYRPSWSRDLHPHQKRRRPRDATRSRRPLQRRPNFFRHKARDKSPRPRYQYRHHSRTLHETRKARHRVRAMVRGPRLHRPPGRPSSRPGPTRSFGSRVGGRKERPIPGHRPPRTSRGTKVIWLAILVPTPSGPAE